MKRGVRLLLVLGALLGLLGQHAAYALGPAIIEPMLAKAVFLPAHQDLAMMDCAEMTAQHPDKPAKTDPPCKGLTLACIAQMGCTVPVLLGTGPVADPITLMLPIAFAAATLPRLSGRSMTPELDPPTTLS